MWHALAVFLKQIKKLKLKQNLGSAYYVNSVNQVSPNEICFIQSFVPTNYNHKRFIHLHLSLTHGKMTFLLFLISLYFNTIPKKQARDTKSLPTIEAQIAE